MAEDYAKLAAAVKDALAVDAELLQRKGKVLLAGQFNRLAAAAKALGPNGADLVTQIILAGPRVNVPPPAPNPGSTADVTAPTIPRGFAGTVISTTQVDLSWFPSSDPVVSGANTAGIKDYRLYRNGSLVATIAGSAGIVTPLALANIGATTLSGGVQSGNDWTIISDGLGFLSTSDNGRVVAPITAITGDFTCYVDVISTTSSVNGEQGGLGIRASLAANSQGVSTIVHPTDITLNNRLTAGASQGLLQDLTGIMPPYTVFWQRQGTTMTPYVSGTGNSPTIFPAGSPITIGTMNGGVFPYLLGASKTSGVSITATFRNFGIQSAASLSYSDTGLSPATQYTYELTSRDNATPPNESAKTAILTVTTQSATGWNSPVGAQSRVLYGAPNTGVYASPTDFGYSVAGCRHVWLLTGDGQENAPFTALGGGKQDAYTAGIRTAQRYSGAVITRSDHSGVCRNVGGFDVLNGNKTVAMQCAPSPGMHFTQNTYWRKQGDNCLNWHCHWKIGNATPPTDIGNRDASQWGIGTYQLDDHCTGENACDETDEQYTVGNSNSGTNQCMVLEPLQDSGHPAGEAHATGHIVALGSNFSITRPLSISGNYRFTALSKQPGVYIADPTVVNCGSSSTGPRYEGGEEWTGPDDNSTTVTGNGLSALFIRGPNHIAGVKPRNVYQNGSSNIFPASSRLFFGDSRYIDPAPVPDWTWSQTDETSYRDMHGLSSSIIAGSQVAAATLVNYVPVVMATDLASRRARLELALNTCGARPADRYGREAAAIQEVRNWMDQNGGTYPSIKNNDSGAMSVPVNTVDPYDFAQMSGHPFPMDPNTQVTDTDGIVRPKSLIFDRYWAAIVEGRTPQPWPASMF